MRTESLYLQEIFEYDGSYIQRGPLKVDDLELIWVERSFLHK